ncbi:hypothetical protein C2S53_009617 [Perilla frutescens var. hirtella]|uniref:Glycosyltransferase n=1 Tax=Perilla frutescens var. hirtella TaxID=608512 RepID=A0AAD4PFT6_PERFH|nr:hypothetical protein C2S53_009617 [Perilla frutescens var. hirtella]
MNKAELVFIPSPGLSHLVSTVEMAKLLLHRDDRLTITVVVMKLPKDASHIDSYTHATSSNPNASPRLRLIKLPHPEDLQPNSPLYVIIDKQTTNVRETVSNLIQQQSSQLAGLVMDMFCTKFIDVAREFGLPSYVFFTSNASSLGLFQHLISLKFEHDQDLTKFKNSDVELSMPCFSSPVPAKVFPALLVDERLVRMADIFLNHFKRLPEFKGIMVNTFDELESYAVQSLLCDGKTPKVYPVGPILNQSNQTFDVDDDDGVKIWLDDQPENSVVFLCFGTMGSFDEAQVREIALSLENCGYRFLWSLRKTGMKGGTGVTEYENFDEVLPEGFLERTKGIGKVIGWAPQMAVLAHPAVGGFVSHCGWNSILESVWFGVPIATFPMYAEQQLNAFYLVTEMGMAEAIRIDYLKDFHCENVPEIVGAEEIEAAIRRLMAGSGVREKVKEMRKKSRAALEEGGSSFNAQNLFIQDVFTNIN